MVRAFVVEDSPLLRKRIIQALESSGKFEVLGFAETQDEAIASIEQLHPAVVITDIRLKSGSGIEVLRQVRIHGYEPAPKVYILTNYAYPEYKRQCALMGADDFFDKTSEYERFLATLGAA